MSYTPTNWQSGDKVTAEKLNKIEQGIAGAGGILVVHETYDSTNDIHTLDKTWNEIKNALSLGILCIIMSPIMNDTSYYRQDLPIITGVEASTSGSIYYHVYTSSNVFISNTEDSYPSYSSGDFIT